MNNPNHFEAYLVKSDDFKRILRVVVTVTNDYHRTSYLDDSMAERHGPRSWIPEDHNIVNGYVAKTLWHIPINYVVWIYGRYHTSAYNQNFTRRNVHVKVQQGECNDNANVQG